MNLNARFRSWLDDCQVALIWSVLIVASLIVLGGAVYGAYLAITQFGQPVIYALVTVFLLVLLVRRVVCWLTGASRPGAVAEGLQVVLQEMRE